MEQACLSAEKTGKNISSAAGVDANSVRSVKTVNVHRGDIYYADLSPVVGSEQGGVRPVLIVQNDVGNRFSPTVIAAAITSQRDKTNLPTHIALHAERTGLQKDSIVLLEQVRTIDKHRLKEKMGKLDDDAMQRVNEAIGISFGLYDTYKQRPKKPRRFGKAPSGAVCTLFVFLCVPFKVQKQDFAVIRKLAAQHSV